MPIPRGARFLLLPLLAAGCAGEQLHLDGFPVPERRRSLGRVEPGDPPRPSPEPLRVLHRSPTTEVEGTSAILVTFNQPVGRLGPDADATAATALEVQPPVRGRARWVAGDTLKLALEGSLQNAQRFTATVSPSLRAVSGGRLEEPVSWTFETPRPRVVRQQILPEKAERFDRVRPEDSLLLVFNLKVDPAEVERALRLTVDKRELPAEVRRYEGDPKKVSVRPRGAPFPEGSEVKVTLAAGLRSLEGPLGSPKAQELRFSGRQRLDVSFTCDGEQVSAEPCWPMRNRYHQGLVIHTSEPVRTEALLRALRLEPAFPDLARVLKPDANLCEKQKGGSCSRRFELQRDLLPRRSHSVRVAARLEDVFGRRLARGAEARFRTRPYPPGLFLPAGTMTGYREDWEPFRFKAVNVKTVEARAHTLRGADLVRFAVCEDRQHEKADKEKVDCLAALAPTTRRIPIAARPDQVVTRELALPRAVSVVTLTSPEVVDVEGSRVEFRRLVARTGLGLQARLTAFGASVWVTALRTGRPLAAVGIKIVDEEGTQLWTGRTDAQGLAEAPAAALGKALGGEEPPRLWVLASSGDDQTALALGKALAGLGWALARDPDDRDMDDDEADDDAKRPPRLHPVELGTFGAWEGERPILAGHVATERGIYRPGHLVYVHGAVRRYRSWRGSPASGALARVTLLGSEGEALGAREVRLSPFGVLTTSLPLPEVVRLGYARVDLTVEGKRIASHGFRIAEYREPPFAVSLELRPKELGPADRLQIDAGARYLFGGAMARAGYRLSVTSQRHSPEVPDRPDYVIGDRVWGWRRAEETTWHLSEGTLDGSGRIKLELPTDRKGHDPWLRSQLVEIEVSSADRQTVSRWRRVVQHAGDRYVAVAEGAGEGESVHRLLVVTPKGEPRGPHDVEAALFASREDRGHEPDFSRRLFGTRITVPAAGALLKVPWPESYGGYQAFLMLSVRDTRGRETRTLVGIYQPSRWSHDEGAKDEAEKKRAGLLEVKLDRKDEAYLPGEVAKVSLSCRAPAREVLLLVERERLFRSTLVKLDAKGRALVDIPVEERFARTVTVRAVAVRGGRALRDPLGATLTGTAELEVKRAPYELHVALRPERTRYQPRQQVRVDLAVKDGLGRARRAQVVVMAVDEAVLQLTHYQLPDPLWDLLRTPSAGVLADDLRHRLLSLRVPVVHQDHTAAFGSGFGSVSGHGHGAGGLGLGGGESKAERGRRRRFLTTAWHATLVTDENGRAQASFVLPDNLTRYRLMAFAVDDSRSSGTGKSAIEVDLPLVTLPALPRLLRVGDRARAGVVVYNSSLPRARVKVTAQVEGAAIRLEGKASQEIELGRGSERELRFDLEAKRLGTARIVFRVTGAGSEDVLEHTLRVQRTLLPEAASVSGETDGAVVQGIDPLEGVEPDHGGLEVSLASTALTGVEEGMEQLIDYPYGCLEQKSSRLLPMLAAVALGDRFSLKLPGRPRELIAQGLKDILALQRSDGGFAYWPNSAQSWPWLTAYALIVLDRARLAGGDLAKTVPAKAIHRAVSYLRPMLDPKQVLEPYGWETRTFIAYALRLHGADVSSRALELFARRQGKPLFARAMLLAALAGGKKPGVSEAVLALSNELGDSLKVDGTWAHAEENLHDGYKVLMHSSDRTTAMVLMALLQARPEHPLIPRMVRWFLLGRKQARFRNTQEAAWALLGMWDFARLREKTRPDFEAGVWLGKERLVRAAFRGFSTKPVLSKVEMTRLLAAAGRTAQELTVAKRGAGTLYYVARLRYARQKLPDRAKDHGVKISRTVQVLDAAGKPLLKQRPPRLGDTLLVTVEVESSEARRYLAVEDPLPAGLEALDETLATGSKTFGAFDAWRKSDWWDHRELRDDRVLFFRDLMQPGKLTFRYMARVSFEGDFLSPPPRAEEMYTPEVYGHGAAGRATFAPR